VALTLRRLSLAALVLIAVLIPVFRPRGTPEPTDAERRVDRLYLLRQRVNLAGARWGALAERDSGAIPASQMARPGRPDIQLRGFGAAAPGPLVVKKVNDLWTWLGPVDSTVRVALVIYNGEGYRFRQQQWWSYAGASVSMQGAGATCVAFLPGGRQKDGTIGVAWYQLESALAPCVLLAGFGRPGRAVERWLAGTRYAAAGSTAWLNRNKIFIDGLTAAPWMPEYGYETERTPYRGLLLANETAQEVAQLLSPPYELGAYGLRCTAGDAASCVAGVLDSATVARRTRGLPPDLTYSSALLDRPQPRSLGTPRPPGEWWLSDLIRDQGREKFARFWKSSAPFESAFRDAFGEDLGPWTRRWSVRQWDNSWFEKYRHSPRILGATLEPSWLVLVLGWAGVALLLTAWVASRRQVT